MTETAMNAMLDAETILKFSSQKRLKNSCAAQQLLILNLKDVSMRFQCPNFMAFKCESSKIVGDRNNCDFFNWINQNDLVYKRKIVVKPSKFLKGFNMLGRNFNI